MKTEVKSLKVALNTTSLNKINKLETNKQVFNDFFLRKCSLLHTQYSVSRLQVLHYRDFNQSQLKKTNNYSINPRKTYHSTTTREKKFTIRQPQENKQLFDHPHDNKQLFDKPQENKQLLDKPPRKQRTIRQSQEEKKLRPP